MPRNWGLGNVLRISVTKLFLKNYFLYITQNLGEVAVYTILKNLVLKMIFFPNIIEIAYHNKKNNQKIEDG